jgi:hypothetical protein
MISLANPGAFPAQLPVVRSVRGDMPEPCPTGRGAVLREVEVKYLVSDAEVVAAMLAGRGIFLDAPVFQDDQAFAPTAWDFGDSKLGVSFLRLRTVDGRHWFAVKQPMVNAQD